MPKRNLRKLFTTEQIQQALADNNQNCAKAAIDLGELIQEPVSRQNVEYWKQCIEDTPTAVNRDIRADMQLRNPCADDDAKVRTPSTTDNSRILIIPDLHAPYHHPDALEFMIDVAAQIRPTRVINLGDETDGHALSFHDSDPNLDSAGVELEKAKTFLNQVANIFPVVDVCHSNHGSLVYRRAHKTGIPVQYIKSYRDILFPNGNGDGWSWHEKIVLVLPNGDTCIFQHQSSGDILQNAAHERANLVQGHEHGRFEINYRASTTALYWSLLSGCLVDHNALAFAYGKLFPKKPIVGLSAIINSQPVLIPMPMTSEGRYTGKLEGVFNEYD